MTKLRRTGDPHKELALFGLADPLPSEGKVRGYVRIPHSSNASAYGFVALPIVVVANGDGPTVLLMAGSHGDEFEGQIAISMLSRDLDPEDISGRVIIFPTANGPAAGVGRRNSPIDGLGLNRMYPGDVRGSPTAMIANYIERNLMSESDIVVDLHGGGESLRFAPCATIMDHPDPVERSRRLAMALAFQAPSVLISHGYEERNSSGAAKRAGATRIATEMGGGGQVDPALIDLSYRGVRNILEWSGILNSPAAREEQKERIAVRDVIQERDYLYGLTDGLFEPATKLGDVVKPGSLAGRLHDPSAPWSKPVDVHFQSEGVVVCQRVPGFSRRGDCLVHLATDIVERFSGEVENAMSSQWVKDLYRRRRPQIKKPRSRRGET